MELFRPLLRIALTLATILGLCLLGILIWYWNAIFPSRKTLQNRLDRFAGIASAVSAPVEIRWNENQIPYIFAQTDEDLFHALGMVHAHLRGSQVDFLLHVAEGRLAELFGHPVVEIDAFLRRVDFPRAVPGSVALLPEETHRLLDAFVAGFNAYRETHPEPFPDARLMGIKPRPLTVEDVITLSKLIATDVNWLTMFGLLNAWGQPGWDQIWDRVIDQNRRNQVSFVPGNGRITPTLQGPSQTGTDPAPRAPFATSERLDENPSLDLLASILLSSARVGSNSVALAPSRTSNGAAAVLNDPHLGINLPNFWLLVGLKSPGFDAVGMMPPGLPVMGLGRNPDIAWGGTNMRAASSDLYDVTDLDSDDFETSTVALNRRFWIAKEILVRESPFGPVISDADILPGSKRKRIALKWLGHTPSDEITPFLRAARADSVTAFRNAFTGYAVAGQNMLVADRHGEIGHVLALRLPLRTFRDLPDLVLNPRSPLHRWEGFAESTDLPFALSPESGFLVSANNKPAAVSPSIGFLYGNDDRVETLQNRIKATGQFDLEAIKALQRDTFSPSALRINRIFLALLDEHRDLLIRDRVLYETLRDWDGRYQIDSAGALAFELFLEAVIAEWQEMEPLDHPGITTDWRWLSDFFSVDFARVDPKLRYNLLGAAIEKSGPLLRRYQTWGTIHRLETGGYLRRVPLVGRLFVRQSLPAPGSRSTVMKSNHGLVDGLHAASYGTQSRHISLLDDLDHNWFVLIGGQDGWPGSDTYDDQTEILMRGEFIQMPLRPESIRRDYRFSTIIEPAATP